MTAPVRVCALAEIPVGQARRFVVDGVPVVIARVGERVYCLDDTCSHEDYSLSEGEVLSEECAIECWKHGSTFSLVDGEPNSLPATKAVAVHEVVLADGDVAVRL